MILPQFVGAPCGHHGPYTFYKAFKYFKHEKYKILTLGEFFFARISPHDDPCIGELQLLWEDSNSEQVLSSTRLYFLPEQTPEGRRSQHGEHEVVAAAEKVILRLSDLVSWITEEVEWTHGLIACCEEDIPPADPKPTLVPVGGPGSATLELPEGVDWVQVFRDSHYSMDVSDVKKEKELIGAEKCADGEGSSVMILSYPRYCRFRSMLKRLDGVEDKWLRNALVTALGGFALTTRNTRVLFCRDTFEHDGLAQHDLNCEHLAPNLKGRPRKKRGKTHRSLSPGAESNTSDESKEIISNAKLKNGLNKPNCKDEQEFLQKLFKFMQERETPIQRVPHLGFKQINLYFFYTFAQRLGGYDKVTGKKLWKHVYDELGGNPGSTSAATCTRRHYERLLLPFERHMNGQDSAPLPSAQSKPRMKKTKKESIDKEDVASKTGGAKDEEESNAPNDNSKPLCQFEDEDDKEDDEDDEDDAEEDVFSHQDEQKDDESKTAPLDAGKELKKGTKITELEKQEIEWEARRRQHSQQKQRECDSPFLEQERRWNEIRKRNALARGRVRPVKSPHIGHPGLSPKHLEPSIASCVTPRTPMSSEPPATFLHTSVPLAASCTKEVPQPIIRQEYEQLSSSSNDDTKSPCNPSSPCSTQDGTKCTSQMTKDLPAVRVQDFAALKKTSPPICFSAAVPFPYAASPLLSMSAHMPNLPTNQHSMLPLSQDAKPRHHTSKDGNFVQRSSHEMEPNAEVKSRLAPSIMAPLFYRKSDAVRVPSPQTAHKNIKTEFPVSAYQCRLPEGSHLTSPDVPVTSQRRPSVILHTEQMRTPSPSHATNIQPYNASYDAMNQKIPLFQGWRSPGGSNSGNSRSTSKNHSFGVCDMTLKQLSNKLSRCEAERIPPVAITRVREALAHSLHDSIKRQISAENPCTNNSCLLPEMQRTVHSHVPAASKDVRSDSKWTRGPLHAHPKRPRLSVTTPYTINSVAKSSPPNSLPSRPTPYNHMPSTSLNFVKESQDEVLDLSLKKTMQEADSRTSPQVSSRSMMTPPVAECLDLSMKKKPTTDVNRDQQQHKSLPHVNKHPGPIPLLHPKSHPILPQLNNSSYVSKDSLNSRAKIDPYLLQNQVLGVPVDVKTRRPAEPAPHHHAHAHPPMPATKSRTEVVNEYAPQFQAVMSSPMYAVQNVWAAQSAHPQASFLSADVQSGMAAYQKLVDQRIFSAHYPYPITPRLGSAHYKDDPSYKRFSK